MTWRRYAIFIIFAFAAVATPTQDPFTMLALAVPMCLLYEFAAFVAWLHDRRKAAREAESEFAGLSDDEASPLDLTTEPIEVDLRDEAEPEPVGRARRRRHHLSAHAFRPRSACPRPCHDRAVT